MAHDAVCWAISGKVPNWQPYAEAGIGLAATAVGTLFGGPVLGGLLGGAATDAAAQALGDNPFDPVELLDATAMGGLGGVGCQVVGDLLGIGGNSFGPSYDAAAEDEALAGLDSPEPAGTPLEAMQEGAIEPDNVGGPELNGAAMDEGGMGASPTENAPANLPLDLAPESQLPVEFPDIEGGTGGACFAPGTLLLLNRGRVPIEQVRIGDRAIIEITAPSGRGIVYNANGTFLFFRE